MGKSPSADLVFGIVFDLDNEEDRAIVDKYLREPADPDDYDEFDDSGAEGELMYDKIPGVTITQEGYHDYPSVVVVAFRGKGAHSYGYEHKEIDPAELTVHKEDIRLTDAHVQKIIPGFPKSFALDGKWWLVTSYG